MTEVIQVDPRHPDSQDIQRAASIIRDGGLVAFPTETVYGLGADAMSESAVRRIFAAKGRPADNPLIVHIESREMLNRVASTVSDTAERLIEQFWPGPLTLVFERTPDVAPSVSAGLDTVAVRMPRNRIALDLIGAANTPLAAPSANLSGSPSPTCAEHVLHDLGGKIDLVIDGGPTEIGIESTVLDITSDPPVVLRPGWITPAAIASITGGGLKRAEDAGSLKRSPGTRHRHYSPRARLIVLERIPADEIERYCRQNLSAGRVGFIGANVVRIDHPNFRQIRLEQTAADYARRLYASLRELDEWGAGFILVEPIEEDGVGSAVMDRLRRASGEMIGGT